MKEMLRESVMCLAALRKKIEAAGGGSDQVVVEEPVVAELLLEKKAEVMQSAHAGKFVFGKRGSIAAVEGDEAVVIWDVGVVGRVKLQHLVGFEECCDLSKLMQIPGLASVTRKLSKEFGRMQHRSGG